MHELPTGTVTCSSPTLRSDSPAAASGRGLRNPARPAPPSSRRAFSSYGGVRSRTGRRVLRSRRLRSGCRIGRSRRSRTLAASLQGDNEIRVRIGLKPGEDERGRRHSRRSCGPIRVGVMASGTAGQVIRRVDAPPRDDPSRSGPRESIDAKTRRAPTHLYRCSRGLPRTFRHEDDFENRPTNLFFWPVWQILDSGGTWEIEEAQALWHARGPL